MGKKFCGRRTAALDDCETFFGWQKARDNYKKNAFQLFEEVKKKFPETQCICIFGELFGGIYPHPDVPDLGNQPIQRGVYYTPDTEFMAFDIRVFPKEGESFWMNYLDAVVMFKNYGFFYAKPLVQGSLEDCFNFDIKADSTIPSILGLPSLHKNQMEGVVIKPVNSSVSIPGKRPPIRAIFKVKNEKFAEVNPKAPDTVYEKNRNQAKEALDKAYEEIDRYINENRLNNLQSKIGPLKEDSLVEASKMLCEDVFKDFCKDNEELWALLDEEKRELVERNTGSKVRTFVSTWYSQNK